MPIGAVPACTPKLVFFLASHHREIVLAMCPRESQCLGQTCGFQYIVMNLLLRAHDLQTLYLVCGFSTVVIDYVSIIVNLYI